MSICMHLDTYMIYIYIYTHTLITYIYIYIHICPPWHCALLGGLKHQSLPGSCGYLRVLAALSSQLLLCRTLSCSCGVHSYHFLFLCLRDFGFLGLGRCCALDSCDQPSLYRMQSVEPRLDTLQMS